MKKIFFLLLTICCSTLSFGQTQFNFSGKITDLPDGRVKLSYTDFGGKWVTDSCLLNHGSFALTGNINGPTLANFILAVPGKTKIVSVFLEPVNMITEASYADVTNLKITGSKSEEENETLQFHLNKITKEFSPISNYLTAVNREYRLAKKQNKSDKVLDSINSILTGIDKQREQFASRYENITRQFVFKHPNSIISAYRMQSYIQSWPLDSVKWIYNSFSADIKNSVFGKDVEKKILAIENNSATKIAKDFATVDLKGKPISLSNFRGKYVLLDFWAHWCVPCRESTPHIIELFKKYNQSGLEVIAIAEDDDKPGEWKKAITKDKTSIWNNVLAGPKTNKDNISIKFGIQALPTKILIDKNGIIIGRYVNAEELAALDKKLAEIFINKN